jgi:hypothetical protein
MTSLSKSEVPQEIIENKILLIRGKKVMLDRDLAVLYGVETRILNQAVRRNIERFPENDFMFQLTKEEVYNLKSQFVISSWGGIRKLSYAFTEHGILMLSSVLKSKRAIQINIQIMRIFTKLREILATNQGLQKKLEEHDKQIKLIFSVLHKLLKKPKEKTKPTIGFRV